MYVASPPLFLVIDLIAMVLVVSVPFSKYFYLLQKYLFDFRLINKTLMEYY